MKIKIYALIVLSFASLTKQVDGANFKGTLPEAAPILGYSPDIIYNIPQSRDHLFILAHGFGDYSDNYKAFIDGLTSFLTTDYIVFNFRDHGLSSSHPYYALQKHGSIENIPLHRSWYSNLGQDADALSLLYFITLAYEKLGYRTISLIGHSRGGGSSIRVIDALAQPQKYSHLWKKLGYSDQNGLQYNRIARVKNAVEQGTIILLRPLIDSKNAFQNRLPLGNLLSTPLARIGSWGLACAASFICDYNPFAQEGHQILKELAQKHLLNRFNVSIYFCEKDENTGNIYDQEIAQLAIENPNFTVTIDRTLACNHCCFSTQEQKAIANNITAIDQRHVNAPHNPQINWLIHHLQPANTPRNPLRFLYDATIHTPYFIIETVQNRYYKVLITTGILGGLGALILKKTTLWTHYKKIFNRKIT